MILLHQTDISLLLPEPAMILMFVPYGQNNPLLSSNDKNSLGDKNNLINNKVLSPSK